MTRKRWFLSALIAVSVVLGTSLFFSGFGREELVLYDADTKEVYASWPVDDGFRFTVEFVHSVNKTPVKDEFEIRSGDIHAYKTTYSSLGAGVQTELREGESLSYDEEGNMVITGFNMTFEKLNFIVGTVSDHILGVDGLELSLTELCGKNTAVVFEVR